MLKFSVGDKVPDDFIKAASLISEIDNVRFLVSSPMILSLCLTSITPKEFDFIVNGKLEVSLCVPDEIPFLVFEFIKDDRVLSFSSAVTSQMEDENCNALNILCIEANELILKNIRIIGLPNSLILGLKNYIDKLDLTNRDILNQKAKILLYKYSDEELKNFKVASTMGWTF